MSHVAFDTLKFMEKLKAAGVPEGEAKAFSEAANEAFSEALDNTLATKPDLMKLENTFKSDLTHSETAIRADMSLMEKSLRADMSLMEKSLRADIIRIEAELTRLCGEVKLLKWMMGFVLAGIAALILKTFF